MGAIYILSRIKYDYCIVGLRPTQDLVEWPIMLELVLLVELGLGELLRLEWLSHSPAKDYPLA